MIKLDYKSFEIKLTVALKKSNKFEYEWMEFIALKIA